MDIVSAVIAFESGEIEDNTLLDLFANLTKSGNFSLLPGNRKYATRNRLIELGYLSEDGTEVLSYLEEV